MVTLGEISGKGHRTSGLLILLICRCHQTSQRFINETNTTVIYLFILNNLFDSVVGCKPLQLATLIEFMEYL